MYPFYKWFIQHEDKLCDFTIDIDDINEVMMFFTKGSLEVIDCSLYGKELTKIEKESFKRISKNTGSVFGFGDANASLLL